MKISIIIPAFNEENCLKSTLTEIQDYLGRQRGILFSDYEIIVVNDGSTDKTAIIASLMESDHLKLINLSKNSGKGQAVKTGILAASGELYLFMDADNSTKISELENFLLKISQGSDIVIGSRALKGSNLLVRQPAWKEFLGKLGNKVIRFITGLKLKDTQCGFKLFKAKTKDIFHLQTVNGWAFDVEILFIAQKFGYKVSELPVKWENNTDSKVGFFSYISFFINIINIYLNNLKKVYDRF